MHSTHASSPELHLWHSFASSDDGGWDPRAGGEPRSRPKAPATTPDTDPRDTALIRRLGENDPTALDDIVRLFAVPLTRFARRHLGTADLADDVVQDTFIALWMRRHDLVVRTSLKSYLFASVRNRVLNVLRDRRSADARNHAATVALQEEESSHVTDSAFAESNENTKVIIFAVRRAVAALPDRIRQAALLRWQDGLSRAEVADVMGVSVATVNNQLTIAARRLREMLSDLSPHGPSSAPE